MLEKFLIRRGWSGLAGISVLFISIAFGQEPPPAAGLVGETERVVVTGSYIPTAETESALPVTVYTSDVLQKQGANTPVEGLRQLPSFVGNTATENDSNGGDGQAFINLRALGAGNTLILINGRRAFGFTNINAISIGALARTEVLKDGASAIYGSDAVAGVVNFILLGGPGETPFQGAEINLLYGNTTDHDARVLQGYVRGGVVTEKVAIAAAAEYYDRDDIYSRDREIARSADLRSLGGVNAGSAGFGGRVNLTPASGGARVLIDLSENAPTRASYRPYTFATDPAAFNFREFTPSIPGVEKYHYFVTGNYKVFGNALQIYGDLLYAKTKQDNGLAPGSFAMPIPRYQNAALGIFNGRDATGRLIDPGNDNSIFAQQAIIRNSPYDPFGDDLLQLNYRFVQEFNNRRSFFDYDFYRYVAGVKGDFSFTGNNFLSFLGYDVGALYERADFLRVDSGDATRGGIYREIIAGNFNPFIGVNAPLSGTVPTYLNGMPTGMTATYDNFAAAQRASYLGRSYNYGRDFLADAKVNGNLFPQLYQGGIGFNFGAEYRQSRDQQLPDPVQAAGDALGFQPSLPSKYKQEVRSIFGELTLPLVTSILNIRGLRSLEVAVAYRYEEFENQDQLFGTRAKFDNGGTPRISLRYQPMGDLTLRASYGQSFLSPSPFDLFDRSQNFQFVFDPLAGGNVAPVNGILVSANPTLTPEKTDTYTAGLVYTPKFLPGFTMTVDLYQVYTTDVILDPFTYAQVIVTANGNAGGGPNAPFAQFVLREDGPGGPQTGAILSVEAQNQNASKRLVNGMDITATYQLPTQTWGTFTLSSGYNYFFTWKAEPFTGAGTTNFLGNYNNGSLPLAPGAIPYHKGYLRGEWEWKGFDFISTVNYISSFNDDSAALAGANVIGGTDTFPQYDIYRRVSDYITLDMQLSYEFRKPASEPTAAGADPKSSQGSQVASVDHGNFLRRMLWGTRLTVGVNNAFDRNPPTVLSALNDSYDTSLYTIRNRYYYISVNKRF